MSAYGAHMNRALQVQFFLEKVEFCIFSVLFCVFSLSFIETHKYTLRVPCFAEFKHGVQNFHALSCRHCLEQMKFSLGSSNLDH